MMSSDAMKRVEKIIRYGHLNEHYFHGNQVFDPSGISICLTEAMGTGGGHIPLLLIIRCRNDDEE